MIRKSFNKSVDELQIEFVPIDSIYPSPENDSLYNRVNEAKQDFKDLVDDIDADRIKDALHVTEDGYILSGHRRHAAATKLGHSEVPIIRQPVSRDEMTTEDYIKLLASSNTQRVKTGSERFRERLAKFKPKAHAQIIADKLKKKPKVSGQIETNGKINRCKIGKNLQEFLQSCIGIVEKAKHVMSVRSVHYKLLETLPMINTSKGSQRCRYSNDHDSSSKLSGLLTRARIEGFIPMEAINDETRSETLWDTHDSVDTYVHSVVDRFVSGYYRDLMIDQPDHIEIIVEKNTVKQMASNVGMKYTIPVAVARGKCSIPPRAHVVDRWKRSGKDKLILILMSDHDPDGEVCSDMWHKSLIGDFGVDPDVFIAIRAGLNPDQAKRFNLPRSIDAKPSSPTYKKFVEKHGSQAYELDALEPEQFELILSEAIESVIDRDAYDRQVKLEEKEAGLLEVLSEDLGDFISERMDDLDIE